MNQNVTLEAVIIQELSGNKFRVRVVRGGLEGREFVVDKTATQNLSFNTGDKVLLSYTKGASGMETVYIADAVRTSPLLMLFFIFFIIVVVVGRWKGALALLGMLFSFTILMNFILPQILIGSNPVFISLLGALLILPAIFYLGHGITKKTTIALVSTFLALTITAILAYSFTMFARLTGFAAEESKFIETVTGGAVNIQSLLLAGIIIGAIGVLDDITISQAAIVERLKIANPKYSVKDLYFQSMEVGRDHVASLVNTLVLVYAGASLPLFVLFSNSKLAYLQVINYEIIATEIVRILVSSIGIVLAVPLTSFLAALSFKQE